ELAQAYELLGVLEEARADELSHEGVELGIHLGEPAPVVYAVRDVGELLGLEGVHVVEEAVFEDIAVQAGDAVYHVAAGEAHVGHVDLAALYDGVACDASAVSAELLAEDGAPAAVY